jgi:hypothetical protein
MPPSMLQPKQQLKNCEDPSASDARAFENIPLTKKGIQMDYNTAPERATSNYPDFPGSRTNAPETSREAAKTVVDVAKSHREKILDALKDEVFGLSSERIAGKVGLTRYAVRPRISELVASGEVIETAFREKNGEGCNVVIWRAA